ncbi:heterokaryon incompatibility protein-domain-containing protein [Ustulina deusta]|nr:heterokaryon incompatibility protein-domain-containing protein [Ustulina deusta]
MADDLGDSLSTITEHYRQPLVTLLLDIQKTKRPHVKSTEFVQALECLCLPMRNRISNSRVWPTSSDGARQPNTFTRCHIDALEEKEYVAISYTWKHPLHVKEICGKYSVQSRDGSFLQSEVRDSVFERAEKYMNCFNLRHLWIDRECVVQEDGEEKETALQAMDLVYHCSKHPIGLLYEPTVSIAELELLEGLMTGQFVEKSGPAFKLSSGISSQRASQTLELLEAIVRDKWWTRAWIYQENYRGGTDMKLLIPHCISSENYRNNHITLFGNIPGELILNSTSFHKAATAFCLAFDPPTGLMKAKELVLERAGKYTLLLEEPGLYGRDLATRSMSPSIIADIEKRQLGTPLDRLPIIANCCQYSARLDSIKLAKRGHSVSLAILALFLLNGEILDNRPDDGTRVSGAHNITDFITAQAFNRYSPPQSVYGLTYNKGCRFIDVELTGDGIRTPGHLWKLGCNIDTSGFPKTLPYIEDNDTYIEDNDTLSRDERRTLMLLANELDKRGFRRLSNNIDTYLECGSTSQYKNSFAKEYQHCMAKELATAVSKGRLLRLGALWSPSNEHSPYRGIFICNPSGPDGSPDYVFTASREREADNRRYLPNDIDRHVSLEVDYTAGNG